MGRIRLVGRRDSRERCVYCHDQLEAEAGLRTCEGCGVSVHAECFAEHGACPTLGCGGVAPKAAGPALAPRSLKERRRTWDGRSLRRRGERPGFRARFGPYARLTLSTLFHASIVLAFLVGIGVLVFNISWLLDWLANEFNLGAFLSVTVGALLAVGAAIYSGGWLIKLPGVFRELGPLLDESDPIPMMLRVSRDPDRANTRYVDLRSIERGGPQLHFKLEGLLPPWWLGQHRETRVWAYGVEDHEPPYLLELPDGRLALLYPDEDD